jgi:glycosyltransferase involved in cell wall biosynthesis
MNNGRPRVRIVLPAYNEEQRLERSLDRLHPFCRNRLGSYDWHLLIADNGSLDGTAPLATRLSKQYDRVSTLHLPDAGRGGALAAAAGLSGADYLLYMDVDLSTHLEAVPEMLEALDNGADIAVGSRHHPGSQVTRRLYREILSRSYNLLLKGVFRTTSFRDAQCGFKVFRLEQLRPLLPKVLDRDWFFDTELLVLAEYHGLKVREVPVRWMEDTDSRVDVPSAILKYLLGVLRLKLTTRRQGAR